MKSIDELRQTPNLMIGRVGFDGGCGTIYRAGREYGSVIWSTGGGWEHVSVSPFKHSHTPTWGEMCSLKDMFFHEDETAVQYHPAKSEYVNMVPNCLHLWRLIEEQMPTPPSIMVGIKKGQSAADALRDIEEVMR